MRKLLSLWMFLLCAVTSVWAASGTEKATNTGTANTEVKGTSYTIAGTYVAGAGAAMAGSMANKGVKLRTGQDGGRVVFAVNSGYVITAFKLYGISNYELKEGKSEPCIATSKVEVDGIETTFDGGGQFPAKGSSTSGSVLLSNISAQQSIAIYFDNSNSSGNQINAYYEITWEEKASEVPTSTTITPASATVTVGKTTTLTGSFTGGDFEGEWLSSDETIATVSQTGVVTGVAEGTATITYQWKEDQSQDAYKATATITVAAPVPVGKADSPALDIMQYETIGMDNAYYFDEQERVLVVSANQIRGNSGQKWMSYEAASGAKKTWNATGVFKGSSFYNTGDKNNAVALRSDRYYHLTVTNCDEISALVLSGGSSKTTITIQMDIYEMESDGETKASETPVMTKSTTSLSEAVLIATGLDKTKVYRASFTSTHASSNSYVYEVAFKSSDPRIAPTLSFPQAAYVATPGEAFAAPTLTVSPEGLEGISYSSSNEAVATVDAATGAVTIVAAGTTTITASFAATDTYQAASASYTLTVKDPSSTYFDNEAASIEWPFQDGETLKADVATPDGAFLSTNVSFGAMTLGTNSAIIFKDDAESTVYTFNTIKNETTSSVSNINVDFVVTPMKGITFQPTNVYFEAARIGHNNGKVTVSAIYGDGTSKVLKAEHEVARNNTSGFSIYTTEDIAISDGVASEEPFTLRITLNKLDSGKENAFRNVKITGTVNGAPEAVTIYTITAVANDDELGTVTGGAEYMKDATVTLTATPKTGAKFVNWQKNGQDIEGGATLEFTATESADYTAIFKKLFAVAFSAGEGDMGTQTAALATTYVEESYTTPAANYYIGGKTGYTVTGWTDGTNNYAFGETITLSDDITLSPVFEQNAASLEGNGTNVKVTWNFDPTTGAPALNIENATGYYVAQAEIDGIKIDVPIYINNVKSSAIEGKTGKTNNTSNGATTAQINEGSKFTIPAVSGMTVQLSASNNISTTTVAGSTPSTGAGTKTATYTYIGSDASVDIVFGNDGKYYSKLVVTYPAAFRTFSVSAAGYRTYCSNSPLDFSGVDGLTAYVAKVDGNSVTFEPVTSAPARTGLLLKGEEGDYTVPTTTEPADVQSALVGVTSRTEVNGAGIYVLMNGSEGVGFYKTTAETFTVGANTAYLPADVAGARAFIAIGGEDVTGIAAISRETETTQPAYNLQGQRVSRPTKGLYIVGGKKMVINK